jgi:hypothetical protein
VPTFGGAYSTLRDRASKKAKARSVDMLDILKQSHCHTVSPMSGCVTGVVRNSPVHHAAPFVTSVTQFPST